MGYYESLREYLTALENEGLLITVNQSVNKDTELAPLVRLQFRGLPEERRKAFLFKNISDSRGRNFQIPVAIGALASSSRIYGMGLDCPSDSTAAKLARAISNPLAPKLVHDGPVQEEVYVGDTLLEKGGLDEFPVPISTPGFDAGPTCSASCWVTKDPETGLRNVGMYRSQLFSPVRMGVHFGQVGQHGQIHWQKCRERGVPLEAAIVIGGPPNLNYVAAAKYRYEVDEYSVSGGICGRPVELVKCKTVDLEVPAAADIVIEGKLSTDELEMEAPHGELKGYMGMQEMMPYFTVNCITHRKNPIWLGIIGQMSPSESSKMMQKNIQGLLFKYLRYDLSLSGVLQVGLHESSGSTSLIIIKMKTHTDQKEVWQALEATAERSPGLRTIIAVDEDIDPWEPDLMWWAIETRAQPHRDFRIVRHPSQDLRDSSLLPEEEMIKVRHQQLTGQVILPDRSTLMINATLKHPYPPVALPKKEYMEAALKLWEQMDLPKLQLKPPWHGYELGYWPEEFAADADRAVRGEYYHTSEIRAKKRTGI